jgi:RNA recognition motif-containing protein
MSDLIKPAVTINEKIEEINNAKKLFIGNLPFSIKPDDLQHLFSKYGHIIGVNVREDRQTGKPKGFAFITYETEESATAALSGMNNYSLDDRTLTVKWATARGGSKITDTSNEVDNAWKTIPTAPPSKKNAKSTKKKAGETKKETGPRTWDQWAGPS